MTDQPLLRIDLVRARDAGILIDAAFQGLQPAESRLALAVLTSLHSRHVAVTPQMTAGLARVMLNASIRRETFPKPWDVVLSKLQNTLYELSNMQEYAGRSIETARIPIRFNASISYTVFRLVAPLVSRATEIIGQAYLFCADDDGIRKMRPETYEKYESDMSRVISHYAQLESDPEHDLFWQERAIMLASLTLNRSRGEAITTPSFTRSQSAVEHRTLPTVSQPELALFLGLSPEMSRREKRSQRQYQLAVRPQLRERHLPDAGADGVFVTRNPDDMDRMLVSEMMYPQLVRLDRIFNSGYFAIERPPKPIRLRDVLVVGLFPEADDLPASSVFSKTCWFEFLLHFSRLLKQQNMSRSELRWIEGDVYQRARAKSMMVSDLPDMPLQLDGDDMAAYRQHFLMKLGWLPSYLDEYAYFDKLPLLERRFSDPAQERVREIKEAWLKAAWQSQKENARWEQKKDRGYHRKHILSDGSEQGFTNRSWQLEQFAYVHVMLFLPGKLRHSYIESEDGIQAGGDLESEKGAQVDFSTMRFRTQLRLKPRSGMSLSITWLPESATGGDWYFSGRRFSGALIDEDDVSLDKFAGGMVETWLDNIMREMRSG